MNMKDKKIIEKYVKQRHLSERSRQIYTNTIRDYTQFQKMSFYELLEEADYDEEAGVRWKHRKLRERLINYKVYLEENYSKNTVKNQFSAIKSFYRHFSIEIHDLPPINIKNVKNEEVIRYTDLPDKDIIRKALGVSSPFMRAIILFMSSSGCARAETLSLTIQDFINATSEYHNNGGSLDEILKELSLREDIVPSWDVHRIKTNKDYYTFSSPESTAAILNYLIDIQEKKEIHTTDKLFDIHKDRLTLKFEEINNKLNLGKVGNYNRFRSHMLRKYHASNLKKSGMHIEEINALQGKSKNAVNSAYFFDDPNALKKEYIEHLDALTINQEVLNYKSPDYLRLETENNSLKSRLDSIEDEQLKLQRLILQNIDRDELYKSL